jgi:hypothetical protein
MRVRSSMIDEWARIVRVFPGFAQRGNALPVDEP